MIKKILFLALFYLPFPIHAMRDAALHNQKLWVKVSQKNNIKLFTRKERGTKILGFKVEGILNAPTDSIIATLRNVELSPEWTPGLITKITLSEISEEEAITYSLNDMPWPASDRELVLHNKLYLDTKKKLLYVISKSIDHKLKPKGKKYVRAHIGYSNMGVRPISKHKTYFEWTIFVDPKGWIPAFLVNFYQKSFPFKFLKYLEKRANNKVLPLKPGLQKRLKELRNLIDK